jgi:hypothetical protein
VSKVRGIRYVTVTLHVTRAATAKIAVVRRSRTLVSTARTLAPGHRVIKLRVPKRPPKGQATVKVTLKDVASGQTFVLRKTIRLPAP